MLFIDAKKVAFGDPQRKLDSWYFSHRIRPVLTSMQNFKIVPKEVRECKESTFYISL